MKERNSAVLGGSVSADRSVPISEESTSRSSVSTASPARAVSLSLWILILASSCRRAMHKEFADVIQKISEKQGEVAPQQIMDNFKREYLDQKEPLHFKKLRIEDLSGDVESGEFDTKVIVDYTLAGKPGTFDAVGNGPIDAVKRGLQVTFGMNIRVLDYEEHALQNGSNAQAAAYIHMMDAESGRVTYGVGVSSNITRASVRAMFSAVNRLELVTGV